MGAATFRTTHLPTDIVTEIAPEVPSEKAYNAPVKRPPASLALQRTLGPFDAAALIISNVIGVGIFTTPGIVAGLVPHPLAFLSVWIAGGALAFAGAFSYAELAVLRPRAGGEYVYLREAFGPLAAFMTGWTSFVAGFSGAIAAGAIGLSAYLGRFFPAAADPRPLLSLPLYFFSLEISPRALTAVAAILALSAIHARGLGPGRALQNLLAGLKVLALLALIGLGFTLGTGSTAPIAASAEASLRPAGWLLALIPVMFTYSGWNAAAYVAEEVRDPDRNLPRALALGTLAVVVLYLLLNLLYLFALPGGRLAGVVRAGDAAAESLFGPRGAELLAPLMLVAVAGGLSAMILAGPRVYFAMARDGLFPSAAARVHPRYRTPAVAIFAQAAWSAVLVLTGKFEQILMYTGFAIVLFSGIAVLALFVLRFTRPQEKRRFRAWGYPVAPALFVLASLGMVANAVWESPASSGAGTILLLAGVPVYLWFARRGKMPDNGRV
jgi:APA family basic amino acid/polyamine antiporter